MKRGLIILALATGLPLAAHAAPPPGPGAAAPAKPLALTPGTRRVTLSPEGNATAAKIMGAPDPRMTEIQAEMNSIKQQQLKLIAGPTIDIEKLEPLFRREEALLTEVRTRKNDRMIALLRALTDPDRIALLQSLAKPAQPQNSKPAQPRTSKPTPPTR